MDKYHPVTEKIQELLRNEGIAFKTFEHAPVRTSEEAMKQRPEYTLKQGAKALLVGYRGRSAGDSEKQFAMFVLPADQRLSDLKVKQIVNAKKISFATKEEADKITGGVEFGGVPPFGFLFRAQINADKTQNDAEKMRMYVDPKLFENEKIIFNAGDRSFSIAMGADDYERIATKNGAQLIQIT